MRKLKIKVVFKYCLVLIIGYLLSMAMNYEALSVGDNILTRIEDMQISSSTGFYDIQYEWMLCENEFACLHEVGHWVDASKRWISDTNEFKQAVDEFILNCNYKLTDYCWLILFSGISGDELNPSEWGDYTEAYATIYAYNLYYKKPIPGIFIEFYK